MRLVDFDVLTFDMIGTLIDFETGVLQFARPRILRFAPTATDTEILECYARAQSTVRAQRTGASVQRQTAKDLGGDGPLLRRTGWARG